MPDHNEHAIQYAYHVAHEWRMRAVLAEDRAERAERQRDICLFAMLNSGPLAADCVRECATFAGHIPLR